MALLDDPGFLAGTNASKIEARHRVAPTAGWRWILLQDACIFVGGVAFLFESQFVMVPLLIGLMVWALIPLPTQRLSGREMIVFLAGGLALAWPACFVGWKEYNQGPLPSAALFLMWIGTFHAVRDYRRFSASR